MTSNMHSMIIAVLNGTCYVAFDTTETTRERIDHSWCLLVNWLSSILAGHLPKNCSSFNTKQLISFATTKIQGNTLDMFQDSILQKIMKGFKVNVLRSIALV